MGREGEVNEVYSYNRSHVPGKGSRIQTTLRHDLDTRFLPRRYRIAPRRAQQKQRKDENLATLQKFKNNACQRNPGFGRRLKTQADERVKRFIWPSEGAPDGRAISKTLEASYKLLKGRKSSRLHRLQWLSSK